MIDKYGLIFSVAWTEQSRKRSYILAYDIRIGELKTVLRNLAFDLEETQIMKTSDYISASGFDGTIIYKLTIQLYALNKEI